MKTDIQQYNEKQSVSDKTICKALMDEINAHLPATESKVWHAHPVWFINGNPIVGYAVRKHGVTLLFWSGQSFEEDGLKAEGSFKAAEARYDDVSQINKKDLKRWLGKAAKIQWDYKNIVKRKGKLEMLEFPS